MTCGLPPAWIAGMGVVTPLGRGVERVCSALDAGEKVSWQHKDGLPLAEVSEAELALSKPLPRVRRSSLITHLALASAQDALAAAGWTETDAEETGLVFATTNGCVRYTRRFFHQVTDQTAPSPMLFPETVYNAPASHLAAAFGLCGDVLTLAGDAVAGMTALRMAQEILLSRPLRYCLVVAAEEADPVTCSAYREWRIPGSGIGLSDAGAAILLSREGGLVQLEAFETRCGSRAETGGSWLSGLFATSTPGRVFISGATPRLRRLETRAIRKALPGAEVTCGKEQLGEAFAAGALIQVIRAASTGQSSAATAFGSSGRAGAVAVGGA